MLGEVKIILTFIPDIWVIEVKTYSLGIVLIPQYDFLAISKIFTPYIGGKLRQNPKKSNFPNILMTLFVNENENGHKLTFICDNWVSEMFKCS